ncbi:MAG: primosomal protein N' [Fusobacteria bacterium]|nr:primosomal protein N' [Fusobacteriota bacterium]
MYQYKTYVDSINFRYFSYRSNQKIPKGTWVNVPFRKQNKKALIIEEEPLTDTIKLKEITSLNPLYPLSSSITNLFYFASDYYISPIEDFIKAFYPSNLYTKKKIVSLTSGFIPQNKEEEAIYTYFNKKAHCTLETLKKYASVQTIAKLIERKVLALDTVSNIEKLDSVQLTHKTSFSLPYLLNSEQQEVIINISSSKHSFHLLHGITGSGKTAVYMTLISECLKRNEGAIFLVPEISLTAQIITALHEIFGECVAILHSKLSPSEHKQEWLKVYRGEKKVVVGVRSAVFAPVANLALIIMDEEHENTYKQDTSPFYHTKLIALKRANLEGAKLLLGSATPSVDSYYFAKIHHFQLHELTERFHETSKLPTFEVVDMTKERSVFSSLLLHKIKNRLEKKEQIILFLNKRGFSKYIQCQSCGTVEICPHCSISLTYSKLKSRLSCHYCGFAKPYIEKCSACGSKNFNLFDYGIEKIQEQCIKLFPASHTKIADSQHITTFSEYLKLYKEFLSGEIDILIGTQIISKGFHFPNLTLVGIINADNILNYPDFRASEKTFQLLLQVAGRSGREAKSGEVVVQTYLPTHYAVELASSERNYRAFFEKELEIRRLLDYPPFSKIILLTLSSGDPSSLLANANTIFKTLKKAFDLEMFGPLEAPIFKIQDRFRYQIFIKAGKKISQPLKQKLIDMKLENRKIRFLIDVDPINFM